MKITSAEYIISGASAKQFPAAHYSEIAFAGRSNVGKSSLINSLLNRKNLVKTSSTPGKTQLINFFLVNNTFYLVDLPGYGYARVPQNVQKKWQKLIESYLSSREVLNGVVLIVDIRHGPTDMDVQLKQWLDFYKRPVLVVANKVDKLKKKQRLTNLKKIQQRMELENLPIAHSSVQKVGQTEIWRFFQQNWLKQPPLSSG